MIRRTFRVNCIEAKKQLYISLVRSQMMYCSQIWRPQLIRDITTLERVQRRVAKFILNDYISSYKSRLQQLNLLPLMYIYELNDLMFLIKSLNTPTDNFNIRNFISFNTNSTSWKSLKTTPSKDSIHHSSSFLFQSNCKTMESSTCYKLIFTTLCHQTKAQKTSMGPFYS